MIAARVSELVGRVGKLLFLSVTRTTAIWDWTGASTSTVITDRSVRHGVGCVGFLLFFGRADSSAGVVFEKRLKNKAEVGLVTDLFGPAIVVEIIG